jgi:hypothetical protein
MTSHNSVTQLAALGLETYSAREAAVLLGRSYSWLDQRVRGGQFTNPDGSVLQPLRTPGAGTDAFASRPSGTSHSAATDIGGSRWTR